jgi:hypothetical protein
VPPGSGGGRGEVLLAAAEFLTWCRGGGPVLRRRDGGHVRWLRWPLGRRSLPEVLAAVLLREAAAMGGPRSGLVGPCEPRPLLALAASPSWRWGGAVLAGHGPGWLCGGGFRVVRGVHVCGLRRLSSSPVSELVGVPSMWRSGGAHGVLRRYSVGFGLGCPLRVGGYRLAWRLLSGWRWWFVPVLVGGREVLELFAGRMLCLGGRPGPTTATPVGAASFLKASSKRVFLVLRSGSPGETLDPSQDRAWAALLRRFAS